MNIIFARDYDELSRLAAAKVADTMRSKPGAVLGLPTGSTPLGMYRELISMYKEGKLSFKDVTTFNLDEYEGIPKEDENSYYRFMRDNFFSHIDIDKERTNIPDGMSCDVEGECRDYERRIEKAGGIDLMVLGIGNNGHIGFNEPASYYAGITHRVKLHENTIEANSRFFGSIEKVPKYAVTMGIKSIMQCRSIMMLASGKAKADAIKKALEGPITPELPASVLQLHRDLTVIVDEEAGSLLK
ncbi:glucosamine-6-phosphate deaminase [Lutispora saccharofermentans]|uniref:Glucosamine-6-phosphate deaminase n=1 Tax=Lutispora saccharofermentans TaxID=3024236 RepID=A0ABT1NJ66_9FIRM|nr:glucosamine-6-phosphate deaminase [Lutispora saccharofermentans]MCQ1530629.1 glucosamine-6-phosphate deaminase [Lutispora saccharofermentans]